jgi:2-succinyl-5-enolpyruvyl-6-hydroxy-3-cyclohexene-1-carboxylate synthase
MPVTTAATFCATLVDEWVRAGLTDAVVAPGSRSTPLALALAAEPRLRLHVHHDERSASFLALGLGLATGRPAVLLCTSGTAAANFHPAVVEAHQAEVPLIVCTADRPPELRDVGAPQTIEQAGLYAAAVRWAFDPGVPDDAMRPAWRSVASRSVAEAVGPRPGPVHLNLPFRDPLVGEAGELPSGRADGAPWHESVVGPAVLDADHVQRLARRLDRHRGVVVAGRGAGSADAVHALAEALSWPVLADPPSGCRLPRPATVAAFDDLLRHPAFASDHRPDVVLRLGAPPASKVLAQWLAASGADQVQVHPTAAWIDPEHTAALRVLADPDTLAAALVGTGVRGATGTPWLTRWATAEARARAAIRGVLDDRTEPTEPYVARATLAALPDGASLVVSSSMPVRDAEWYADPRDGVRVLANRGANGIDGVVSTAVGVALGSGTPTALLIGDVALLHDTNGFLGLADRDADLVVVAVDNRGGGIFEFLPQASQVPRERFELLFGTPHHVHLPGLAGLHGVGSWTVESAADVGPAVAHAAGAGGVHLVHVRTHRQANVAVHDDIHRAVQAALG